MFANTFSLATVALLLAAATQVDAHGHLVDPKPDFGSNKAMSSSFAGRIPDPNVIFSGSNFPKSGTKANYQEFMKHFKGGSKSLKEIILANNKPLSGASKDCGFTVLGTPQALPSTLLWGKNEGTSSSEGFRPTHLGACETYCDNTLVQKNDECAAAYNAPGNKGQAKVPIEASKCKGAKQLTFYWLSTQAADEGGFQVYANCVALSGASSGGAASSGNSTASGSSGKSNHKQSGGKTSTSTGAESDNTDGESTTKAKKTKKPKTKKPSSSDSNEETSSGTKSSKGNSKTKQTNSGSDE